MPTSNVFVFFALSQSGKYRFASFALTQLGDFGELYGRSQPITLHALKKGV